jgi:hypothetical protein
MAKLELFRDLLADLYLCRKMTLSEVKKYMEEHCDLQASYVPDFQNQRTSKLKG